ncbi:hypothetical protein [Oceaniferula marina]|nr:hypothetical protein [Oceaniferula marina]
MLSVSFQKEDKTLHLSTLNNLTTKESLTWDDPNVFTLDLPLGSLQSSKMKLISAPKVETLKASPQAAKLSSRSPGKALVATFADEQSGIQVQWRAEFRENSNYFRQILNLRSSRPVTIENIQTLNVSLPEAKVVGYTDGSPVVCGNWFLGLEHPMAKNSAGGTESWSPADMANNKITRHLKQLKDGTCSVTFKYAEGNHGITITKASLLSNGKIIATDVHGGFSGIHSKSNSYTLKVPAGITEATLVATLNNVKGQYNGSGEITVDNGIFTTQPQTTASLPRGFTLKPEDPWTVSTQIGCAPPNQIRRAFAYYLQRERAHPYRQYWHYNSWYDLNIGRNDLDDPIKRMNEQQCLDVIKAFDKKLFQKHQVGVNGFVWDDGWDDWNSLWGFHEGFPHGFTKLNEAALPQGAKMGAWLSPWGGYGRSHKMRVDYGKKHGYETNAGGFSLGGIKYRTAYRDACLKMIKDYNQDYFKFDGIGGGMWATGAPATISADLDGLIKVIEDLRQTTPSVFINCTVGTWASPYWLCFADSIWRQGEDTAFSGKGNPREQWINYKDSIVYRRFAHPSPLFPVNSMMYHGLTVGPMGNPAKMPSPAENINSYSNEVRMMAAYASTLGELYVTPAMLTDEAWAVLAESIQWARTHQKLLSDTHWIGGDPAKHQIYGFAAWHPDKGGVITLRNPDDRKKSITLDLRTIWELPTDDDLQYTLHSPWIEDHGKPPVPARANTPLTVTLQPFEVLTLQTKH